MECNDCIYKLYALYLSHLKTNGPDGPQPSKGALAKLGGKVNAAVTDLQHTGGLVTTFQREHLPSLS